MAKVEFLSKVKATQLTMARKWDQRIDNTNQVVRGVFIEKVPNLFPETPLTVIGETIINEGYWMPKGDGKAEFIVTAQHQAFLVAKGMRTRFKVAPEDIELVEEQLVTGDLAQVDPVELKDNRPIVVWKLTWEDGTNEWVAARDKEEAAATLQHHTGIGQKDLETLTITREDMRKSFYQEKEPIRFGAFIKTLSGPAYICQDIEE